MNRRWRLLPLVGLVFLLAACQQQQAVPPPPPPQVTVSQPVVREVVEWDDFTGRLEAVEMVEVRARVSGYLQSVHFTDGELVKKGALLFVIDPRPYQAELNRAQAAFEQAVARYEQARKDFARAQPLVKSRAISQEEFDTRASEQRQAAEAVQAARAAVEAARLNVEFTQVRAPIGGRISREYVTVGNLINGGTGDSTLLTRIVSLDPIYGYFDIDERSFLKYTQLWRNGTHPVAGRETVPVYLGLANESGFPHQGRLDFIDNRLDPHTGTMTARAIFPNPDLRLVPGLFARIRVPGSDRYEALLIPDEAIGTDQTQRFVFVVNAQNTVEYRKVTPGPLIDGVRVIREGLKPEEWVVVNGVQRVRAGVQVEPQRQALPQDHALPLPEATAAKP
ncbi:MAG TPA: efflux RND transporter periplasmic adaptor subunit [Alphaproteobacteria bacterium]|nr:efflux RND transporter periplasmic adaptor subunit [Alphaproteobacteria bacterium]